MRLEAWYVPAAGGAGSMRLRLVNTGRDAIAGFELTFTTVVQLDPAPPAAPRRAAVRAATSSPHRPASSSSRAGCGSSTATCGHRPGHANDGPASAFVTLADGATVARRHRATRRVAVGAAAPATYRAAGDAGRRSPRAAAAAARRTAAPVPARRARAERRAAGRRGRSTTALPADVVPVDRRRAHGVVGRGRFAAPPSSGRCRRSCGGAATAAGAGRRARARATTGAGCTSTWPASSCRPRTSTG